MNGTLKTILEETFWLLIPLIIGYFVNTLRRSNRANLYKKLLRITSDVKHSGET